MPNKKNEKQTQPKRGPIFRTVFGFIGLFKKKPKVINYAGEIESKAIYISNHSALDAPLNYILHFPKFFNPWGTFEMVGKYKERWNYMYHIFYRQKLKKGKFSSFIKATILPLFSIYVYRGVGLIPTYPDGRLVSTMRKSMKNLDENKGVLIFPEDSTHGYDAIIKKFNAGFVKLSNLYFRKKKVDVPVYPMYYNKKTNTMVIDKPIYVNEMFKLGKTQEEIAEDFRIKVNSLYEISQNPQMATN